MTNNSLFRVMIVALVLVAACKSDFPAGSYDDGGAKDTGSSAIPTDEQSCLASDHPPQCDLAPPSLVVTSAPGGPLLAEVRVTDGPCGATACPSGCETMSVSETAFQTFGVTCDLVAISTDGRSQSFRVAIVRLGPDSYMCCGDAVSSPGSGRWVGSTPIGFDPPQVIVDFNRDAGVPDAGVGSPDGRNGDSRQASDLSPAPRNCSDITDQQSCEDAICSGICEWSGPFMSVTSAPGGPLLTEVRVTSGWCTPDTCSTSRGSPSCSSLSVTTTDRTPAIGTTCDLVAVATDGRSQSFRITVVQSGPAYNQCCGSSLPPYSGQWVTFASLAFDPPEVVVDFNRDGGVLDSGPNNTDGFNDAPTVLRGVFVPTGSMTVARLGHTATLLPGGQVLIAGGVGNFALVSAELYDPATGIFTVTGNMTVARAEHTATLLSGGKVLIVGGSNGTNYLTSADTYDPATRTFTATGSMTVARTEQTATLLRSGKVLIAGGAGSSAELYDPAAGTFTATGSMTTTRTQQTATLLPGGKVLIAGGYDHVSLASAELYDPTAGTFTATSSMTVPRYSHTATLLLGGKVLIAGGDDSGYLASAELYDPVTGTFSAAGSMTAGRASHTATLLSSGKVLIASGDPSPASAELYDPGAGTFAATGDMTVPRAYSTATLLGSGKVLVAGGLSSMELGVPLASAELYQ